MSAAHLRSPSVPAPERVSGCTGKIGYPSRADAKRMADKLGSRLSFYRCRHCDLWHGTTWRRKGKPT